MDKTENFKFQFQIPKSKDSKEIENKPKMFNIPLKDQEKINLDNIREKPQLIYNFESLKTQESEEEGEEEDVQEESDNCSPDLSFESIDSNENKKHIKINPVKCKYELKLLKTIISKNNLKEVFDEKGNIYWTSISIPIEDWRVALKPNKFLSRVPHRRNFYEENNWIYAQ